MTSYNRYKATRRRRARRDRAELYALGFALRWAFPLLASIWIVYLLATGQGAWNWELIHDVFGF